MNDSQQKDLAFFILQDSARIRKIQDELRIHRFKDSKSIYDDVKAPRNDKHGGYIALDGIVKAQTNQCCHCGGHWVVRIGSGILRGFCNKCQQHTCGKIQCDPCVPWEKKMEMIEARERQLILEDKIILG